MNAEEDDGFLAVAKIIDEIQNVLDGKKIEHVMTALCALIGYAGFEMYNDEMSKQKFIAHLVEDVEDSYETAKRKKQNG